MHWRKESGFIFLLEIMVVAACMLVFAAMSIAPLRGLRAASNSAIARNAVQTVYSAQAAIVICAGTPQCAPQPALTKLIPVPGTITTEGYRFVMVQNPDGTWGYVATPINSMSGNATYTASQDGFSCRRLDGGGC